MPNHLSLPWRRLALMLGLFLATAGAAALIRFQLVELSQVALACDAGGESAGCLLRRGAIALFSRDLFGWAALLGGLLLLAWPRWWLLALTLTAAAFGLLLYNSELAALGLTLVLLAPARLRAA